MTGAVTPVLVIGGGVAGAAVAAHLAQAGRSVLLVERRDGPHHKVCGEFVSGEAALYLDDLAVDLAALGAVRMRRVRLGTRRNVATASLPFPAWSVSRRVLDEAVLAAAAERGAIIRRGRGVRALAPHGRSWIATLDDGDTIAAAEVFLATGKHDLRGWKRPSGAQDDLIAFKLHWRLAPDAMAALGAGVELTLFPGGYAGLEPVEDGIANLCLVVRQRHFAALGRRWEALLAALCAASPLLAQRLDGAMPCWSRPLAIASIPYGYVALETNGMWRLGDQAAVIPSFTGDGLALALHSGRLAAHTLLARRSAHHFHAELHRQLRNQLTLATVLSRALVAQPQQTVLALTARVFPATLRAVASHTRLPSEYLIARLPKNSCAPA